MKIMKLFKGFALYIDTKKLETKSKCMEDFTKEEVINCLEEVIKELES